MIKIIPIINDEELKNCYGSQIVYIQGDSIIQGFVDIDETHNTIQCNFKTISTETHIIYKVVNN